MTRRDAQSKHLRAALARIDQANREAVRRSTKSAPRLSKSRNGASIADTFRNGRLIKREVSPALEKGFAKDVYTPRRGLPRRFDQLFMKGVDEKNWRLSRGHRPYIHSAEGGPGGIKKKYHSAESVRMDRAIVGQASRRGEWPLRYSKYT